MRKLLFILCFLPTIALAAVWWNPQDQVWVGNVCQTPIGWQFVPSAPVGSVCYSPGLRTYGFIANA